MNNGMQRRPTALCSKFDPLRWLIAAAAFVGTLPALAQSASGEPQTTGDRSAEITVFGRRDDALSIETATGSRLGLTPLEIPASIAAIDGDELRARGDFSVVDAVTRAPGVTTSANPGNGGTALVVRGFGGQGSILQLYDGIRLFPVAGTITFPADPWNVERIEVLSGPASVLYGQGALGGAVNIVTKAPNAERQVFDAQVGYGSQDTWQAAAGAGGPLGEIFSYRVDGSYRRSDGYVDRGDSRSYALSAALRFAPGESFSLTLRDDYGNLRPTEYFGTPLIAGRLDERTQRRNYNVADAELHYRDNRTTLTAEWRPSAAVTLSNTAYRLTSKRLFKNLESYFYNGTTGLIDRFDNLGIVHDQEQWGNQGSVKLSSPDTGGVRNDLVIGFDVNLIKLTYSNDFGSDPQEDSVDPFNPAPGLFFDTQGIAPRYRTRTNEWSAFAEDRLELTDALSLVGGIRFEKDRVRRWNITYAANGTASETRAFDKRLNDVTWRVGGVWQPMATLSLYGQYATGVDPIGTLTTFSPAQTQFKNTTGDQVEAGAKLSFLGGRGSATVAAYRIVKKNLLVRDPNDLRNTTPLQVGQRSAKGIEASLTVDLPGGFGIDANGTVLDAAFDSFNAGGVSFNGKTPPNTPETAANLWLRWDAFDRFQARGGLRHVGRTFSDNANRFRVPDYAVVDGSLSYALTSNVAVDLHLYNLFDKDYASTAYNDEQYILGRPRSVEVAVRARF